MSLLRCPKFLRCLTADAGNFDRGHSLTSLPLPPAALSSLPTASVRTGFAMTGDFTWGAIKLPAAGWGQPALRIPRSTYRRADVGIGPYERVSWGA